MSNKYFKVYDWMYKDLKDNEVYVFALIYSFCEKGKEKEFNGSFTYIAERLHISDRQVRRILKSLVDKGYLYKRRLKNGNVYNLGHNVLKTTDIMSTNNKTIYGSGGIVTNTTTNKKVMKKLVIKNKDGTLKEVS